MLKILTGICLLSILSISCRFTNHNRVKGSGNIIKKQVNTGAFESVDASGAFHVYVRQDSSRSVTIETDDNLLEYIEVKTEGNELVIRTKGDRNLDGTGDIKIIVSSPTWKSFDVSGASEITSQTTISSTSALELEASGASSLFITLDAPRVSIDLDGASSSTISGRTRDLSIDADGASHARCFDLKSENASVDADGASTAEVFASQSLKTDAGGASHIRYKGVTSHSGGAGGASSIEHVD